MLMVLKTIRLTALIAQSVEHVLGKNGVMGSNPIEGFVTRNIVLWKE